MRTTILAIESSCDETSAAILRNGKVLSNIIATQEVHKKYGGVVPELASRAHQQNIIPVVNEAIESAGIAKTELDAIGFTRGPGLLGALIVGTSFAKALAYGLDIPLIEVNHMQAHILAHFIDQPQPSFPFLCLTVSGGHTQIVLVRDHLDMEVIGETQDDAAGEAFDKSAKLLGLDYPGGPMIDKYTRQGNPHKFKFARSNMPAYDFSFSGLKTSVLYFLRDQLKINEKFIEQNLHDLAAGIQFTIIEMLMDKLVKASHDLGINQIAIAGGVSANSGLREEITRLAKVNGWESYIPKFEYCTDNAAMIGIAAHYKYLKGNFTDLSVSPKARMPLN